MIEPVDKGRLGGWGMYERLQGWGGREEEFWREEIRRKVCGVGEEEDEEEGEDRKEERKE